MEIIKELQLSEQNYINIDSNKTKICLYSSNLPGLNHYDYLKLKENGNFKGFPHFTITEDGKIYQHFDINYQSQIFYDNYLDKQTIFICLSNLGWLKYDTSNETFINWCNMIVNEGNVMDKIFREIRYWDKYTDNQLKSSAGLCKKLCEELNLKKEMVGHCLYHDTNTKLETIYTISNIDNSSLCLNPSFDFKLFYKKLNLKK